MYFFISYSTLTPTGMYKVRDSFINAVYLIKKYNDSMSHDMKVAEFNINKIGETIVVKNSDTKIGLEDNIKHIEDIIHALKESSVIISEKFQDIAAENNVEYVELEEHIEEPEVIEEKDKIRGVNSLELIGYQNGNLFYSINDNKGSNLDLANFFNVNSLINTTTLFFTFSSIGSRNTATRPAQLVKLHYNTVKFLIPYIV